jgi:putative pyrroloquinoline-quinone binding quinoprotein
MATFMLGIVELPGDNFQNYSMSGRRSKARRAAAIMLLAGLATAAPAQAVIPGVAPGLAAVLPQVLFFLITVLALLFSPRAWGRFLVLCWRHPGWTAGVAALAALIAFAAPRASELFPAPAPGAEISTEVNGFPVGDPGASRSRAGGPGPLEAGDARPVFLTPGSSGGASREAGELSVVGDLVVVLSRDRRKIALLDPAGSSLLWECEVDAPITAGPVGSMVVTLAGDLLVLGSERSEDGGGRGEVALRAPGVRAEALAVVDGVLLVCEEGAIGALSLDSQRLHRRIWTVPRPSRKVIGLAGDDQGRYFLLDEGALLVGELTGGAPRELGKVEHPLRLAVEGGLVFVLGGGAAGKSRISGLDPAAGAGEVWSRDVDPTIGDEMAVGASGIVLAHQKYLEVLDPDSGATTHRLELEARPSCVAAVGRSSVFAALAGGQLIRYSFTLDRIAWRTSLPTDGGAGITAGEIESLVVARDRLVFSAGGRLGVLASSSRAEAAPWGQWRGGPMRAGTSDGDRVPLSGRILWRRELGAADPRLLPLPEGWIAARSTGGTTSVDWIDDRGGLLATRSVEGACSGMVRLENRVFAALKRPGGDRVACLAAERPAGAPPRLVPIWSLPLGTLGEREPLALDRDTLVVALAGSVIAVSAIDGKRLWESPPIEGVEAPLLAGGRVFLGGRAPGRPGVTVLALGLEAGEVRWKHERGGDRRLAVALADDVLVAVLTAENGQGRVVALSTFDGARRWEREIDQPGPGPPVISEGRILVHDARGGLVVLSAHGEAAERIDPPGGELAPPPPPVAGVGVLLVARGHKLRLLDSATFEAAWEVELPAPAGPFALARGQVLVPAGTEIIGIGAGE